MRSLVHCLLVISVAACAAPVDTPIGAPSLDAALSEGSREAVGVLALLNDPATSEVLLDIDVALDRRAASGLIAHRNGADGLLGTDDDDLFDSIEEVDSVRWVGPSALARLSAYADREGYTPSDDTLLGEFDGVAFTYGQADAVLALVNDASRETLRAYSVPSRAITSIEAARPIDSMPTLASLYWVGTRTLEHLRDAVATSFDGRDCRDSTECPDGYRCEGRPYGLELGKCRDATNYPGIQDDCDIDSDCNEHLICIAQTVYGQGYCADEWMRDSFTIAPAEALGVGSHRFPITVYGQASVPEDIWLRLNITGAGEDLRIGLQPPTGQEEVTIWDGETATGPMPTEFIDRSIYRDDMVNGIYELVVDVRAGSVVLESAELTVTSRWD